MFLALEKDNPPRPLGSKCGFERRIISFVVTLLAGLKNESLQRRYTLFLWRIYLV
jgi:hypothetical protein